MKSLFWSMSDRLADMIAPADPAVNLRPLKFYGANARIQEIVDGQVIVSGPADCGKTIACLHHLNSLCWQYPGLQAAIIRKTFKSIAGSVVESFRKKVIMPNTGITFYGGDMRTEQVRYPNGAVIWVGGMDNPDKVLSSERDVIYINQVEELQLSDFEYLVTRANGRAGNMPGALVLGDCNPGSPSHWIQQRARLRKIVYLEATHRDNPTIYNPETGELTPDGARRLESLASLSGARLQRLYYGLWAAPEGAIYDFDETRQKIKAFTPPASWPRIVGIDPFGAYIAALWLAFDPKDGVLHAYREYREPFGITTPAHVKAILELSKGETIFAWVGGGPSERQARTDWTSAGIPIIAPAITEVWAGIDRVDQLLKSNALLIHDCCEGLVSEIGEYRRVLRANGEPTDTIEDKEAYHMLDTLRYAVAWLAGPETEQEEVVKFHIPIGPRY